MNEIKVGINIKNIQEIIGFIKELEKLANRYGFTFINELLIKGYITIRIEDLLEIEAKIER